MINVKIFLLISFFVYQNAWLCVCLFAMMCSFDNDINIIINIETTNQCMFLCIESKYHLIDP